MTDQVPADDRGLLLGDGLFETVLFKAGRPILWDAHVARLFRGCEALGLAAPDAGALSQAAAQAVAQADLGQARAAVRLTWTAGSGGRGLDRVDETSPRLIVTAALAPKPDGSVGLALSDIRRNETSPTARHKTVAYLDNVLARRQAQASGADEAVLLNSRGELACCAAANLFWLVGDSLFTPALDCGALDGIMRAQVLAAALNLGLAPSETRAPVTALAQATSVFITNSLIGVRAVSALDGRLVGRDSRVDALASVLTEVN
ncbi:MAG TPA: aminotransferase class IV [Caulobacteraceae bacterium]|nr:aminotransferase class IV [Caulobacteraceae bacterium]